MIYVTSVGPDSAWKSSCGSYKKVTLYLCLCMITESLCAIFQWPKFPCRMSAPLPLHDVLPRQCTFFPLPQACCFILGHFIWCLPTSAPYCKLINFTLSMLVYTIYHLTSPSHMVSPFNLSLCRRCSMSHNRVLLPFTRSSPLPLYPLRQGTWSHVCTEQMWCARGVGSSLVLFSISIPLLTVPPIAFLTVAELTTRAEQNEIKTLPCPLKTIWHSA